MTLKKEKSKRKTKPNKFNYKFLIIISITLVSFFSITLVSIKFNLFNINEFSIFSKKETVNNYYQFSEKLSTTSDYEKDALGKFVNRIGCEYNITPKVSTDSYDANFQCNFQTRAFENPFNYTLYKIQINFPNGRKILIPKMNPYEEVNYGICLEDFSFCFVSSKYDVSEKDTIDACWKIEIKDWFSLKEFGKQKMQKLVC